MADYHISLLSDLDNTGELRVLLLGDEDEPVGHLDALSLDHARLIAHDLMALVRQRDPRSAFVLDTHIGRLAA